MEARDKDHLTSVLSALPYHFEDVEVLPRAASFPYRNPPRVWVAVHTKLFNRPVSVIHSYYLKKISDSAYALRIDIARGSLDAPKLLSRIFYLSSCSVISDDQLRTG